MQISRQTQKAPWHEDEDDNDDEDEGEDEVEGAEDRKARKRQKRGDGEVVAEENDDDEEEEEEEEEEQQNIRQKRKRNEKQNISSPNLKRQKAPSSSYKSSTPMTLLETEENFWNSCFKDVDPNGLLGRIFARTCSAKYSIPAKKRSNQKKPNFFDKHFFAKILKKAV